MLAKSKLNSIEISIFRALIDSNIGHDEFVLINNVLKEMTISKKKSKVLTLQQFIKDFSLFIKQCYCINSIVEKIQKSKIQKFQRQKAEE